MSVFYKASTMCLYKAFRRPYEAFVRILLFLYKDSTMLLKCIYKVFTKVLQCVYIFPQGSYKAMFHKDFRLLFVRCFTCLLYFFYVLFIRFLQGFEKVITRLLQGFYTASTMLLQSF